jgi:hypothetical protein
VHKFSLPKCFTYVILSTFPVHHRLLHFTILTTVVAQYKSRNVINLWYLIYLLTTSCFHNRRELYWLAEQMFVLKQGCPPLSQSVNAFLYHALFSLGTLFHLIVEILNRWKVKYDQLCKDMRMSRWCDVILWLLGHSVCDWNYFFRLLIEVFANLGCKGSNKGLTLLQCWAFRNFIRLFGTICSNFSRFQSFTILRDNSCSYRSFRIIIWTMSENKLISEETVLWDVFIREIVDNLL